MKTIIIAVCALILTGCSDPEQEANKLFSEAGQLISEADGITEKYSLEAYNKRNTAVELLLKIPVQYPESSLSVKITGGNFKIQNQSINEISKKMTPDISIHDAAQSGNIGAIELHLHLGQEVDARDADEQTPLHFATQGGRNEIAKLLIANGADVNAKKDGGFTPLFFVAFGRNLETTQILIANGADVNAKSDDGETPLDWAVATMLAYNRDRVSIIHQKTALEIAKLLRKNGAKTTKGLKAEQK
jgi:hypothetical protein